MDLSIYLRYYSAACIYFSFRWGPFVHSLKIVQWDSTRRGHPGYPGWVSGSGLVNVNIVNVEYFHIWSLYIFCNPLLQNIVQVKCLILYE